MPTPTLTPTVLVVEDDHLILLNARLLLETAGCRVLVAGDAVEALRLLNEQPDITAVFTDVAMPGPLDGLELAAEIHQRWPAMPVHITSGSARITADRLPPSATFLPKPYTAAAITRLLAA
jgi:CheY-like chemotaxis protein